MYVSMKTESCVRYWHIAKSNLWVASSWSEARDYRLEGRQGNEWDLSRIGMLTGKYRKSRRTPCHVKQFASFFRYVREIRVSFANVEKRKVVRKNLTRMRAGSRLCTCREGESRNITS